MFQLTIIFLACSFYTIFGATTLRQVFIIGRHGDRTPIHNVPNHYQWPHNSELTGLGQRQLKELGDFLRERYIVQENFLSEEYRPSEVWIRSTAKKRALVSAQSLLFGLYPPGTGDKLPDGDEYALPGGAQAIPIHSEGKMDFLLHGYKNCPALSPKMKMVRETTEWREKEAETKNFRAHISKVLGLPAGLPLHRIPSAYHGIKAERIHRHVDGGVTDNQFKKIEEIKNWVQKRKYWTRSLGRLGAGMLVDHITDTFEAITEKSYDGPKFTYFSAHDGTLLALFSAMGIQSHEVDVPHYAALVLIELHEIGNEKFEVRIEYKNGDNQKYLLDKWEKCPIDVFFAHMKDGEIEFEDYVQECGMSQKIEL